MRGVVDHEQRRVFAAALAAWTLILLLGWFADRPLGHDEAAYALGGQALRDGHAPVWLYRSVGMHVVAAIGVVAGGSEHALRAPAVLLAIGFLFAVRHAGRRLLGGSAGAWAAAVVVGAHAFSVRACELLSDLPSAACLLMGLTALAGELGRTDGPRLRVVAAAPWFAAAFYLRYASCVPIAVAVGVALLVWWRAAWARPVPVLAMLAALALLLLPHALHAIAETGSPLGIIRFSSGVPRRSHVGEGLETYLASNPLVLYGALAGPLVLLGLASIVRPPPGARRTAVAVWLIAVAQIVVLGLLSHGTPRYIYFALTLLIVLGVDALGRAARHRWPASPAPRRLALGLIGLSWVGVAIATVWIATVDDWRQPVVEAGAALRRDARGRSCHVVSRRFTQLMWYGGCDDGDQTPPVAKLERGELVYRVWTARSDGTPDRAGFTSSTAAPLDLVEVAASPGRYEVTRVTRRPD